jgi:hypothetical protein
MPTRPIRTMPIPTMVRGALSPDERSALEAIRDRLTSAYDRLGTLLDAAPPATAMMTSWAKALNVAHYYGARNDHRARNDASAPPVHAALSEAERLELETARAEIGRARADVRQLLGEVAPPAESTPENQRRPIVSRPRR